MSVYADLAIAHAEQVVLNATLTEANRILALIDQDLARMQEIVEEMGQR